MESVPAQLRRRRLSRRILTAVALCVTAAGCSGPGRVVVVYTPLDPKALGWMEDGFESANPDVDLRLEPVASADVLSRLTSERSDPQGDLVWGVPSWILASAAEQGLLAETSPSWSAEVPPQWKDPQDRWVAVSVDPVVFAINHDSVSLSRAPRDWIDLLHPRWSDEILVPEPGTSAVGSLLVGVRAAASVSDYGDPSEAMDWFRRLDGNRKRYGDDDADLVARLQRGWAWIALTRLSVAETARESERDGVEYVVPQSGTPVLLEGVGLVAGAPHAAPAARFLDWLGSPAVVGDMEERLHRRPAWKGLGDDAPGWLSRAWDGLTPQNVSSDTLAAHLDEWVSQWRNEAKGHGMRVLIP